MANKIKTSARKFLKENKVKNLTADKISEIIKSQGYKIIRFGKAYNDENTEILISGLELNEYIQAYSAFTYTDDKYRLLFLEDNISEKEALILLAHEEGHIYNKHFGETVIAGKNTLHEYEANEFSHYILNPTLSIKIRNFISNHRILTSVISILLLLAIVGSIVVPIIIKQQSYYGNYYYLPTGTRFHEKDCFYIRDKKTKEHVTKDIIIERDLEPCKVCLPELRDKQ